MVKRGEPFDERGCNNHYTYETSRAYCTLVAKRVRCKWLMTLVTDLRTEQAAFEDRIYSAFPALLRLLAREEPVVLTALSTCPEDQASAFDRQFLAAAYMRCGGKRLVLRVHTYFWEQSEKEFFDAWLAGGGPPCGIALPERTVPTTYDFSDLSSPSSSSGAAAS